MSLTVDISAPKPTGHGYEVIAALEIRCLDEPGDDSRKTDGKLHTYLVTLDSHEAGTVDHRYADGRWALIQKAVALVAFREANL